MRVAIVYTPAAPNSPAEDLDGIVQMEEISAALAGLGHESVPVAFGLDLDRVKRELEQACIDRVFNLVESVADQDRLLVLAPILFSSMKIAYTGCGPDAITTTTNKTIAKHFLSAHGIPTPAWLEIGSCSAKPPDRNALLIVKPVWDHGSAGITEDSLCNQETLPAKLQVIAKTAARPQADYFAEQYIHGREFNLSVLSTPQGICVLPAAEIRFDAYTPEKPRLVGYQAKWDPSSFEYQNTPRCFDFQDQDRPLLGELKRLALDCFRLFGLSGYARVDFRVDEGNQPWILEINANPCLSKDAGFMAAAERDGWSYPEIIDCILHACKV